MLVTQKKFGNYDLKCLFIDCYRFIIH